VLIDIRPQDWGVWRMFWYYMMEPHHSLAYYLFAAPVLWPFAVIKYTMRFMGSMLIIMILSGLALAAIIYVLMFLAMAAVPILIVVLVGYAIQASVKCYRKYKTN